MTRGVAAQPLVVLVGPPAAGKTVVGELLSERLGGAFADTDADVAVVAGKPVGDIFTDDGEAAFRELERAAAQRALAAPGAVVALGSAGSTCRSVWMLAYHRPAEQPTVMFLALPRMSRLLRYRIQPSLGRKMRLWDSSISNCWASG